MAEKKSTNIRIDSDVLDAIDARAKERNLSRNEWIEKCCRWALHNLPYGADGPHRRKVAAAAPPDVAGTHQVNLGLDDIEGK
jgi:hypothetical protein